MVDAATSGRFGALVYSGAARREIGVLARFARRGYLWTRRVEKTPPAVSYGVLSALSGAPGVFPLRSNTRAPLPPSAGEGLSEWESSVYTLRQRAAVVLFDNVA